MKGASILLFIVLFSQFVSAQKSIKYIPKNTFSFEIDYGSSFPDFDKDQDQWKASFYPTWGISGVFSSRLKPKWAINAAIGLTGYALVNKGPYDSYIIDFASPEIRIGTSYNEFIKHNVEAYVKAAVGAQMGYNGSFTDEFDKYRVIITSHSQVYYFMRQELGLRFYTNKKFKRTKFKVAVEAGVFYRYNFANLGTAKFEQADFEVTANINGNIVGMFAKVELPMGSKRIKLKQKIPNTTIYNPRF